MNRIPVRSSLIASVGYKDGTLEIAFVSKGSVYQYHDVPEAIYDELMNANSHGQYFIGMIRGAFVEQRIR